MKAYLHSFFITAFLVTAFAANAQFVQQGEKLVGTGGFSPDGDIAQGSSVAISADGNTAIVGGYQDNDTTGAAWIFTRTNGVWTQQGNKLVGTGAISHAEQGYSVGISADGNTVIIGGPTDNDYFGAAWIFTRTNGVWTQQGDRLIGIGSIGDYIQQGCSVSLSADGNTAIIGGAYDNHGMGAAWVFTRTNGVWTQQGNKLVGTGAIANTYGSHQGSAVSLSADGNTAIIGGDGDDSAIGAAWIFTRTNSVWAQQGDKLVGTGTTGTAYIFQGYSVSLSADGNTAIIGGFGDNNNIGASWIFIRTNGVWAQQNNKLVAVTGGYQGNSVSLSADGNTAVIGPVSIFKRTNGIWVQQGDKLLVTGAVGNAGQGSSVSLSADGNTAIVGGPYDNNDIGAAWIFARSTYCTSPILSNPDNTSCPGTMHLSVADSATQIVWYKDGSPVANTNNLLYADSGTTVAGGHSGSAANQLSGPPSLFIDAAGNIFIADDGNNRIQKWEPGADNGITVAGGNGQGSAANQLYSPKGVFVDAAGNIFIADYQNNRIQKWAPGANSAVTVAGGNGGGRAANQLHWPTNVFVDAAGNIFIADNFNNRIQKWAPGAISGTTVAGGNSFGSAANQLYAPQGIFVDTAGNIFIADTWNNRIQKWIAGVDSGITVAGGYGSGYFAYQLNYPTGVFVDAAGNIFIADAGNHRIQKWAPGANSGTTVAGINLAGSNSNQLKYPSGVFVDPAGSIFIADELNYRIQKWDISHTNYMPALPGTYTAAITYSNGCVVTSNPVTASASCINYWTGAVNTLWSNPGNWSLGMVPNANTVVVINTGSIVVVDIIAACYSLHIAPVVNFSVNPRVRLLVTH